jgi:hypothetical protein
MDPIIIVTHILPVVLLVGGSYLVWSGISAQADDLWERYMLRQQYKGLDPQRNAQREQDVRAAKWRSSVAGCILIVVGLTFVWTIWSNGLY